MIYSLAIGLAELSVRRALSQKFRLDSTLALETTKIDRTGLNYIVGIVPLIVFITLVLSWLKCCLSRTNVFLLAAISSN